MQFQTTCGFTVMIRYGKIMNPENGSFQICCRKRLCNVTNRVREVMYTIGATYELSALKPRVHLEKKNKDENKN